MSDKPGEVYLGDGLYASFDGYQFKLAAWNGIDVHDQVFLEPDVLAAFMAYVERKHEEQRAEPMP